MAALHAPLPASATYQGVQRWLSENRLMRVVRPVFCLASVLFAVSVSGAIDDYESARHKVDQIEGGRLRAGSRVDITPVELNAYIAREAPPGVRNPKIQLVAPGVASGTALIDFNKLERGQGVEPGWLMSRLLEGEKTVVVTARIRSSAGHATVDIDKAEIAGVTVDGRTLDFLIQNFVIPQYPDVSVGQPFELGYHISKLDVRPTSVGVVIGR
jgi:hypothetical protein